ncbi:hypothetical protein BST61_g814 [Cercospora zeina]
MVEIAEINIDIDAIFSRHSTNGIASPLLENKSRGGGSSKNKPKISFEDYLDFLLLTSKLTIREVSNMTSPPKVSESKISRVVQVAIGKVAEGYELPRQEVKHAYDVTQQEHGVFLRRAAETSLEGIRRDAVGGPEGEVEAEVEVAVESEEGEGDGEGSA